MPHSTVRSNSLTRRIKIVVGLLVSVVAVICLFVVLGNSLSTSQWPFNEQTWTVNTKKNSVGHLPWSRQLSALRSEYTEQEVIHQAKSNESQTPESKNQPIESIIPKLNRTPPPSLPWYKRGLKVNPKSLMSLPWIEELWTFLHTKVDRRWPVAITSANFGYRSSLLNWLAHSLVKLGDNRVQNILVLCMDSEMHEFLQKRTFSSLLVPFQSLSKVSKNPKKQGILRVEVARLVVMRLINFWGFDVLNYDSDAFVLKNPQDLFDKYPQSHVIGSESYMPKELRAKWGVSLCMGVVLVRASQETDLFWNKMNQHPVEDDQKKINFALNSLGITFDKRSTTLEPFQGKVSLSIKNQPSSFLVTILPMEQICRGYACVRSIRDTVYVWHRGGGHDYKKMTDRAAKVNLWLIREDWANANLLETNLTGIEWLKTLMIET